MNKREVSEIKKNFKDSSNYFTLEKVLVGFVDYEGTVLYHKVNSAVTMTVEDRDVYDETLKKVLSTAVGKKFTEYEFLNEAYEEGKPQNILYTLLESELNNDEVCEKFLNHIANNIDYAGPFTVITAYCTYSVPKKNKNDDFDNDNNEELYRYLLTAICPVSTSTDGFIFDKDDNEILKKINSELIIDKSPSDGFLFPTFSNRSSDINHVMYYSKSSKKPNFTIVENVLGCQFVMSADVEKASFQSILQDVAGDNLDYNLINTVNERIKDVINEDTNNTELMTIEPYKLKEILSESGLQDDRLALVESTYKRTCGEAILTASNLVDTKNTVNMAGIKIDIKPFASDKVRTSVIDGHKCLLIDIDEPIIEINGLSVKLD